MRFHRVCFETSCHDYSCLKLGLFCISFLFFSMIMWLWFHSIPTSNLDCPCVIRDTSGIITKCEQVWVFLYVPVCMLPCAFKIQPSTPGDTVLHPQRWWHDKCVSVVVCVVKSHTTAVRWATLLTDSTQWMNYTWLKPQLTARLADIKAKWQMWHITVLMYLKRSCSSKCELST